MAASPWLLLLLLLLVLPRSARAAVGYGPFFDGCGDNCQTALRIFCTEGLDGAQQRECWCASREYGARMAACLATCDPAVSNVALQREAMLRFRAVVCGGGPAVRDPAFAGYYSTRYRGAWKPTPTSAAPPPPVDVMGTLSSGASASASASAASTVAATRRRTSSATTSFATQTRAAPSSPSSSTATSPSPSSAPTTASRRLSTAAIVGVSLGSLAAFTSLLLLGAFLARRHQRSKTPACGAPTTPTQPSSDWPPPSRIQRRESVYYSPDDVGGVGVGVVPEVRVTAATPSVTEIEVEDAEEGGGGGGGDSACSSRPESSSAGGGSSEWTSDCDDPHEFWDIGFDREGGSPAPPPPDVSPEEEYYRGRYWNGSSSRSSSSSSSYAYCEHPGRRWPDGGGSGVGGGRF